MIKPLATVFQTIMLLLNLLNTSHVASEQRNLTNPILGPSSSSPHTLPIPPLSSLFHKNIVTTYMYDLRRLDTNSADAAPSLGSRLATPSIACVHQLVILQVSECPLTEGRAHIMREWMEWNVSPVI